MNAVLSSFEKIVDVFTIAFLWIWVAGNFVSPDFIRVLVLSFKFPHFPSACTFAFSFSCRDVDVSGFLVFMGGVVVVRVRYFLFISCSM